MRSFAEELLALIEARVEAVCAYRLTDNLEPRDLEEWKQETIEADIELEDMLDEARHMVWLHDLEQARR